MEKNSAGVTALGLSGSESDEETSPQQANGTALEALRKQPQAVFACLAALFTSLMVSFEAQASSTVIAIPEFRKDFGYAYDGNYVLYAAWQGAFSGGQFASCFIGTFLATYIGERIGRKYTLIGAILLSFVGVALEFVAVTNAMFFGGKFINGAVVGTTLTITMLYVGEVAPLAIRGTLTCINTFFVTFGQLLAAIIVNETGTISGRWAYRAVLVAQLAVCGLSLLLLLFLPESPAWYVGKGQDDKAIRSLKRLGVPADETGHQLAQMRFTLEEAVKESEGATYLDCFRQCNLRRTVIAVMPLVIQALCGSYFVQAYATYYAQLAGVSTTLSYQLQIVQYVLSMVGNITSWYLVEKVGRRSLTFWGLVVLQILLLLASGLGINPVTGSAALKTSVAMFLIFAGVYSATVGATAYTIVAEIPTARLRSKTISLGIGLQYLCYIPVAFVVPVLFNPDQANLGSKTAFIFCAFNIAFLVYLWLYQVEPKGRSYGELDELFAKKVSVKEFQTFKTEFQKRAL